MATYKLLDEQPTTKQAGRYVLLDDEPAPSVSSMFKDELMTSLPGSVARGMKDVIDTGAGWLSKLGGADEAARIKAANQQGKADFAAAQERTGNTVVPAVGRVGGQILATTPVVKALGAAATLAKVPRLGAAITSAGMTTGRAVAPGLAAKAADIGIRSAGGAIAGGTSAGLVNPEEAGSGALVGGVLPIGMDAAGYIGRKASALLTGPSITKESQQAIKSARDAGYVMPPSQAKPSLPNRLLEGYAGKISTAQNASAKNAQVTNDLAASAIGLPKGTQITTEVLDDIRKDAGKAYEAISDIGKLDATRAKLPSSVKIEESISPLLHGKIKSVDSGEIVRAWKQANADATAYYRAYARDANPETLAKAKSNADAAKKIDDFLSMKLNEIGKSKLGEELKNARRLIAKTYSVESALNSTTGNIDARKLAQQLKKGKPLSGKLKQAAEFAGRFPKAAQAPEGMGSLPQFSPLDWATGGAVGAVTGNPLYLGLVAGRPIARQLALSNAVQNRLATTPNDRLLNLLRNPATQQMIYRAAPVSAAQ